MKRVFAVTVCGALLLALPASALALYMEMFGNQPKVKQPDWADGVVDVVNLKSRVFCNDVNGNEHFFYRGNAAALKDALDKFATIKEEPRQLILLPGTGKTHAIIAKKDVDFDWQLHVPGGIFKGIYKDMRPTMTVFIPTLKPKTPRNPQEVKQWLTELDSSSFETREKARKQLQQLGNDAKPYLREALKSNPTLEARMRIEALLNPLQGFDVTDLHVPRGVTTVSVDELLAQHLKALKDGGRDDRAWAIGELRKLEPFSDQVVPALIEMLNKNQDEWHRRIAASSLAPMGFQAKSALPALREGLTDPDANVRKAFESAIAKLETATVQPGQEEEAKRYRAILEEIDEFKKSLAGKPVVSHKS
jgi:HEAT repeat protein